MRTVFTLSPDELFSALVLVGKTLEDFLFTFSPQVTSILFTRLKKGGKKGDVFHTGHTCLLWFTQAWPPSLCRELVYLSQPAACLALISHCKAESNTPCGLAFPIRRDRLCQFRLLYLAVLPCLQLFGGASGQEHKFHSNFILGFTSETSSKDSSRGQTPHFVCSRHYSHKDQAALYMEPKTPAVAW